MINKRIDKANNTFVLATIILLLLNFFSSLSVIYLRHLNRSSMASLQGQIEIQDKLYQEWTQLLLEQHTLISYNRVDKIARDKLAMRLPNNTDIHLLNLNNQAT